MADISVTSGSVLLFSREANESETAWAACLTYCQLPPDIRSVRKAQDEFYINSQTPYRKKNQASAGWEEWCRKFKWRERASLIDTKKTNDFLSVEHAQMIKARDDFNKLGEIKYQAQIEIEILFNDWRRQSKEKGYFAVEYVNKAGELIENDPGEVGSRLDQVVKILRGLNESDRILSDRRLTSVGIKSLIPD